MQSPGETVALVRAAYGEEVPKWRITLLLYELATEQLYTVWRPGFRDGEMPPFDPAGPSEANITAHSGKTRAEATAIIADAAWAAAVTALEAAQAKEVVEA